MEITLDTIEPLVEEWSDPGDYPSNAGGGPLPSYSYLAGLDGELIIELNWAEYKSMLQWENVGEWLREEVDYGLPDGILSADWEYEMSGGKIQWPWFWVRSNVILKICAFDAEGDPDWRDEPEHFDDDYF